MSKDLDFTVESGKPVIVRVTARGKRFTLRLAIGVSFVRDTGDSDAQGLPVFSLSAGTITNIEEDKTPALTAAH